MKKLIVDSYGVSDAILTDSGTSALRLAIELSLKLNPRGYCLLPGFGCYDLATAAIGAGARVILYDIDPKSFAPRIENISKSVLDNVAAFVAVHHFGIPTDLTSIADAIKPSGAVLIEDAAQAVGARWNGERVGGQSAATVLSFGRGKGITGGGGGALLFANGATIGCNNQNLSAKPEQMVLAIKLIAQWILARPLLYWLPASIPTLELGETIYHPPSPVRGMTDMTSRILTYKSDFPDGELKVRIRNAKKIADILKDIAPDLLPNIDTRATPGWLRFPLLLGELSTSSSKRAKRLGILKSYPVPLSQLEPLKEYIADSGMLEGADTLSRSLWTIPTHGALSENDFEKIRKFIGSVIADSQQ